MILYEADSLLYDRWISDSLRERSDCVNERLRACSVAPVSKPEPAKSACSRFEIARFAKFGRAFGRAGFETGATRT